MGEGRELLCIWDAVSTRPRGGVWFLFLQKRVIGESWESRKSWGRAAHVKRRGEVPYVYSICYNNNNDDDNDNVIRIEHTLGAAPTRFIDCFQ